MAILDLRPPIGGAISTKIDYLSFTIPGGVGEVTNVEFAFEEIARRIYQFVGDTFAVPFSEETWSVGAGMAHYSRSVRSKPSGCAVWFGGAANHILVQLPGTACSKFDAGAFLSTASDSFTERITRLDIACDIDIPDLKVGDFTRYGYAKRFKSGGTVFKPTGITHYVGSRDSERFARVYRYSDPHPRAHLLRVEYELKGGYAKRAGLALKNGTVSALARTLGDAFGWKHPAWDARLLDDALSVTSRGEREGSGSVLWLMQQVLPAMERMQRDGIFDVKAWLENTVLPGLE